jgi:hypothetical protein
MPMTRFGVGRALFCYLNPARRSREILAHGYGERYAELLRTGVPQLFGGARSQGGQR